MELYTEIKTFRVSKIQSETLKKMKLYKIDVGQFIRDAIKEKIKLEYQELIPKQPKIKCPF